MNIQSLLESLTNKKIISESQAEQIHTYEHTKPFSVYWELRSLLFLGITFLSTGLGILVYNNIDTLGHNSLIAIIITLIVGCFYFVFKNRKPFTWSKIEEPTNLDDFALIGGCLLFLTLEGYLQFQYTFFGTQYGLATILPAILFFYCAYRFDNRGVLSMAITALASWVGVNITPTELLKNSDFNGQTLTITAILLGIFLVAIGWISEQKLWKKHFSFTYFLLGGNLAFAAALSGIFTFDLKIIFYILMVVFSSLSIYCGRKNQSFIFLLMGVLYGYIAFTNGILRLLPYDSNPYLYIFYFMASGIGILVFLIKIKQIIGLNK